MKIKKREVPLGGKIQPWVEMLYNTYFNLQIPYLYLIIEYS